MLIHRAKTEDLVGINKLLCQVLEVHHKGRPDIFKSDCKKYTDKELLEIIADDQRPIFVAENDGEILGYAFCILQQNENSNILTDIKTLYIDDLCVDEQVRGKHIGTSLYEYVCDFAKQMGCYNITLNVWAFNENAMKFYEKCGMQERNIYMEKIL